MLLPRTEPRIERRREHVGRHRLLDSGQDRPATLTGILYEAAVCGKVRVLKKRHRRQIEQPGGDHAATPPHLCHFVEVEIIARDAAEDIEALGVRLHHPVFDAVVNHFDEMAGAGGTTVQISVLNRARFPLAPRCALDLSHSRSQRLEDRIEALDRFHLPADHHAVAAIETPDAAARPHVNVMNPLFRQMLRPPQVVLEIRVTAVDDYVARFKPLRQRHHRLVGGIPRRNHDPGGPWLAQPFGEVIERSAASGTFAFHLANAVGVHIEDDAVVIPFHQATNHVRAHPSESDHAQFHVPVSSRIGQVTRALGSPARAAC